MVCSSSPHKKMGWAFPGALLVIKIDGRDDAGIWMLDSLQHTGRPCPEKNRATPDLILVCPTQQK